MMQVIPAIMPKNFEDLKQKIALVRDAVSLVQIDLCDGTFSRTVTWPFNPADGRSLHMILEGETGFPYWEDVSFEFDLMVRDGIHNFDMYLQMGPSSIVFHLVKDQDLVEFAEFLEGIDIYVRENTKIGVAIETCDEIQNFIPIIPHVDFVQCMGIEKIGYQEQEFDERVLTQIQKLKKLFPNIEISVDGAVNAETAESLVEYGADRLVIGSAIYSALDPFQAIKDFEELSL